MYLYLFPNIFFNRVDLPVCRAPIKPTEEKLFRFLVSDEVIFLSINIYVNFNCQCKYT